MERDFINVTPSASARRIGFGGAMRLLFRHADARHEFVKLAGKRSHFAGFCDARECARVKRLFRIVAGGQALDVTAKRFGHPNDLLPPGLAGHKSDFDPFQIDVLPCEPGQVAKSLPRVETEENEAFPFGIGTAKQSLQFWNGKRAAALPLNPLQCLHVFGGILPKQAVARGLSEDHAEKFNRVIHRCRAYARRFGSAISEHVRLNDSRKFAVGGFAEPRKKRSAFPS